MASSAHPEGSPYLILTRIYQQMRAKRPARLRRVPLSREPEQEAKMRMAEFWGVVLDIFFAVYKV